MNVQDYRAQIVATYPSVRAELAAGGRRRRMALKALELVELVALAARDGYQSLVEHNVQQYRRFVATIGYNPIAC